MKNNVRQASGQKTKDKRQKAKDKKQKTEENVSLASLSKMTHFPVNFIKNELFLEGSELSLSQLREKVSQYLEKTHTAMVSQEKNINR